MDKYSRTELLIGKDGLNKLKESGVAVFGIGGVGGYVVEALARSGVGKIALIDNDTVCDSNINRQIIATTKTLGRNKVDVAEERILDINPNIKVEKYNLFYTPQTADEIPFEEYNYIVDAIDTVVGKLSLIEKSKEYNLPIICSMGAGNKMDPTKFEVSDISKTSVCPLAKVIRQELRKRKIKDVKVVYSKELPVKTQVKLESTDSTKKQAPGSISFVPSVVGLIMAGEVIKDLIGYGK